MLNRIFPTIMVVSGLLTLTMLYAAISPVAAVQSMFQESPAGAMATVVVPNWGILIGLMGALLIWGGVHAPSRRLALVVAGASKIAFIALVLMQGDRYLGGLSVAVAVDSVMVALFAIYLIFGRPGARKA
ncbi:MAG: hypothetical protein WD076_11100 [Parvularculaceae bacterium]